MTDLILPLIAVVLMLGYVSVLLYMRLTSRGVRPGRIWRVLTQLWATFAAIAAAFLLSRWLIGETPRGTVTGEMLDTASRIRALPPGELLLLIATVGVAVTLFVLLLRALRAAGDA